jgi:isoleucyl-tRNA synthetase
MYAFLSWGVAGVIGCEKVAAKFKAENSRRWLTLDYSPLDFEQKIRELWEKNKVQQKMEGLREKNNKGLLGFVEGPPTLNGIPHIGHYRGRAIKDLRYRLKTMQGFYVPFWAGWDCQGLPVELEVERELKVGNKKDIVEKVGEECFIAECKKAIMKYHKEWLEADKKFGVFMNHEKAYWTYLDGYIEREWQYLKRAWDQDLLGEGYYVVAYCPNCQTSLSNAEVGLGYEQVEDPSLYFKMKARNTENEYFLVWTTMPFTLVTDTLLTVLPEAEYAKVKIGNEKWILAKQRVEPVMQELKVKEYQVTETMAGEKLIGVKYDYPFLDTVPKQQELDKEPLVHTVIGEDFVDVSAATGVVHLSPGNGEDDFRAAQRLKIPIYVPFDDGVRFTVDAGEFAGLFARDADAKVIEILGKKNLLVQVKTIKHEYPTCWRSHHKLIWLARREYYLWTDKVNAKVVEAAEKVGYYFEGPKNRFLAFLKEGKPWCVSRDRIWGAPLPIWVCENCRQKVFISSKKELFEKALEPPSVDFELHKPWIDRLTLKCEKCGGKMKREPYVLDTWHNSGACPYARFTDEDFLKYVPTDFLVEAIDQTRGWANTLLSEHVLFTGRAEAPYKNYLFYGFALDAKGRKMSKSLGNILEINPLLERYSADVCRFYLFWKCSPVDSMNFDAKELTKRPYQVLGTLYHLHKFFMQNAEYDNFNPRIHTVEWTEEENALNPVDRWLLSKLQKTVKDYTDKLEKCEFNFAVEQLETFVVDIISRQYIPMIRRDLWSDAPQTLNRRLAVYATLWQTLRTTILLFNPVTPFISEFLHQKVYRILDSTIPDSINYENWPTSDPKLQDAETENAFATLFEAVALTYSARQTARMKRRWPLQKAVLVAPKGKLENVKKLEDLFLELANVKTVEYHEKMFEIDVNQKRWAQASEGDLQVLLDKQRDEKLLGEGVMRDVARRVQSLRKELGFTPTDILEAVHLAELDAESTRLLAPYLIEMAELVRTKRVQIHNQRSEIRAEWHEYLFDNKRVYVAIT